ncbi:MAG: acyl carrier protein [Candidatus Eremiobacteraeota bacterium]|nr:acyl carrier protein [Candidatus Eremiobacteraeota bacterium]MBV8331629.1 acyl carrier protein [Candidatus Eremiobacteraeota bacterium]MBV8433961.1 acyl carrier protein [Candidatus Eremiobacteraeota bacterium]MBV8584145.1 acyl carrier protein [Candidatus Eremiobacteraeota bacterium]MBV8722189.1 acyl carrier protein [Candidatus Eremiobacteraeota bacterium]
MYDRLTGIIREVFDDDTLVATPDLIADHVDGWDSFAQIRLIVHVERAFGVDFAAAEIASFDNVGDLAARIHSKLQ